MLPPVAFTELAFGLVRHRPIMAATRRIDYDRIVRSKPDHPFCQH
ncbi:hypothetical protein V473_20220 [Sphingobium cupriresistens LL01]|uniref:Uncharacterized protein n=1 Tax=Sphingobium cupriresistens LL01 TaxID=1420583 RepID=A0A0J7XQQ6_9SPHN|nr:hypothetical protein V473_20220 [Sphingobium cupriresistens LL01]